MRAVVIPLVLATTLVLSGQQRSTVGTVTFPNSGAAAAQADFIRGVAWLHSFGYEEAIDAFRRAQGIDPNFAMAYWGESLAFSQPLWFFEEPDKGRSALAKFGVTAQARLAKAKTPREQGFIRAVEALWGPGDTAARARAYAGEMAKVAADNPADDEAQAFYALALLGTMPPGDSALPIRRQAGAIAERVFAKNPNHPGAAHYILHAYDHVTLAPKALAAARAYAKIAPAASHALHMPAHTFVQLGLWHEAATTDEASWQASIDWAARRKLSVAIRDYHSLTWLHYEWTQQGRFTRAQGALGLIDQAISAVGQSAAADQKALSSLPSSSHSHTDSEIGRGSGPTALRNDRGSMRARYVIESARWTEMKGQTSFDNVDELFALGFSAVKLGDAARAAAVIEELGKLARAEQSPEFRAQAEVMWREMEALDLFAQNRRVEAFVKMDTAYALQSRMPKPIGRPYPVKPVDELYGELLLEVGQAKDAVAWFERALARTPNRSRALLGLARAHGNSGNPVAAKAAYQRLMANWTLADASLPELAEARAAVR